MRARAKRQLIHRGAVVIIPLSDGTEALIDAEDECLLPTTQWSLSGKGYVSGHAKAKGNPRVYLHRIVMKAPLDRDVDHVNRDRRDCRKQNLRLATNKQNHENMSVRKDSLTGVRGVHWDAVKRRFIAHVTHNYKTITMGTFLSLEQAAIAVRNGRRLIFTHSVECGTSPESLDKLKPARQMACKRGHALDESNTSIRSNGTRLCRACDCERARKYRSGINAANREAA